VAQGLLKDDAAALMAPYLKLMREGRPWVILKWAQSIDGKIATRCGDSKWISSPPSRRRVHLLRGRVDAVVVGVETVRVDDPRLTCRGARVKRVATRVVLDPALRTPTSAMLVKTSGQFPTLIVTAKGHGHLVKARTLSRRGVEVLEVRRSGSGLDLTALLREMGRRGMANVLVEGGGRTLGRFMDAMLADEAWVFVSPRLIGGEKAPCALAGSGPKSMRDVSLPSTVESKRSGSDLFYRLLF
jgi:diaminohydroxyphosphoribosylaminopyrimidine deaminase/5-amino-6-(5-phosphoribosylamino)uracil reductase